MPTATVTSKGQITIPASIREQFGIRAGSRVHFFVTDDGIEFVPATRSVSELAGMIEYHGEPVTIEQMDDAIGEYLTEKHGR
jgi:AbrB family looped-hinge helix DNA binding protein